MDTDICWQIYNSCVIYVCSSFYPSLYFSFFFIVYLMCLVIYFSKLFLNVNQFSSTMSSQQSLLFLPNCHVYGCSLPILTPSKCQTNKAYKLYQGSSGCTADVHFLMARSTCDSSLFTKSLRLNCPIQ